MLIVVLTFFVNLFGQNTGKFTLSSSCRMRSTGAFPYRSRRSVRTAKGNVMRTRQLLLSFWAMAAIVIGGLASPIMTNPAQAASQGCLPGTVKQRLGQIRRKFGPIRVISTFRRGARIAGSGRPSYHASCRAVDFHPPRGQYRQVVAWLKRTHGGGVGTYSCGMHHIHIDNGPRIRFHHCVNAAGRPRHLAKRRRTKRRVRVAKRRVQRKQKVALATHRFSALRHFSSGTLNGK